MRSDILVTISMCMHLELLQTNNAQTLNEIVTLHSSIIENRHTCVLSLLIFSQILFQPGEIVLGDGCSKLCHCAGNYTFDCIDNSCDPTEECREVNGVEGCYPKGNHDGNNRLELFNNI